MRGVVRAPAMLLAASLLIGCGEKPSGRDANAGLPSSDSSRKAGDRNERCFATGHMPELACAVSFADAVNYLGPDKGVSIEGYLTLIQGEYWLYRAWVPSDGGRRPPSVERLRVEMADGADFDRDQQVLAARGSSLLERNVGIFGVLRSGRGPGSHGVIQAHSVRWIRDSSYAKEHATNSR